MLFRSATLPNTDGTLTDGQTVRVIIEQEKPQNTIAVPQQAIAIDQTGPYLFVVNDKNVVELRRIKVGVTREGMATITEGLKAGEKVIVQGQQRVREGMTVSPSLAPASVKKS